MQEGFYLEQDYSFHFGSHTVLLMASLILWLGDPDPKFGGVRCPPAELYNVSLVSVSMITDPISSLNTLVLATIFFSA